MLTHFSSGHLSFILLLARGTKPPSLHCLQSHLAAPLPILRIIIPHFFQFHNAVSFHRIKIVAGQLLFMPCTDSNA